MASTGDRFDMPDGSTYEVTAAATDSDGDFVGMDFTLPVGSMAAPTTRASDSGRDLEVIEGALDLMVDGKWTTLHVGESASVAPGTLHTFKNRCGQTVRVRNVHRPRWGSRTTSNTSTG